MIELGRDADGKRRQKWFTVHGVKRNAWREQARGLADRNAGGVMAPDRIPPVQRLASGKPDLAPETFDATR